MLIINVCAYTCRIVYVPPEAWVQCQIPTYDGALWLTVHRFGEAQGPKHCSNDSEGTLKIVQLVKEETYSSRIGPYNCRSRGLQTGNCGCASYLNV